MKKDEESVRKVYCRICRQVTNHNILNKTGRYEDDEESGIWVSNDYYTLQCKGCEIVCLLKEYTCSEDYNPETGQLEIVATLYPDPFVFRAALDQSYNLPNDIRKIYEETISAFNRKLPILTSIGIRATIEAICIDNKITKGTLEKKIDELVKLDLMTKKEANLLHLTRFMGNASAHNLKAPVIEELKAGLEIIESALRNGYILPATTSNLLNYKRKQS